MHRYLRIIIGTFIAGSTLANEPSSLEGQTEKYRVVISSDHHPFDDATISAYEINKEGLEYSKQTANVKFSSQCSSTQNTITCQSNGKTPLSGATYKITEDATPICPGEKTGARYTCLTNCPSSAPTYLRINEYEC